MKGSAGEESLKSEVVTGRELLGASSSCSAPTGSAWLDHLKRNLTQARMVDC